MRTRDISDLKRRKAWTYWNTSIKNEIAKSEFIKNCRKKLMELNKFDPF